MILYHHITYHTYIPSPRRVLLFPCSSQSSPGTAMQAKAAMIWTEKARDYADKGPLPDRDMEEDTEILPTTGCRCSHCLLTERTDSAGLSSWKTTWSPATAGKDNFGHSAALSGIVSATAGGPRHDAIPLTWQATALGERTVRYWCFM